MSAAASSAGSPRGLIEARENGQPVPRAQRRHPRVVPAASLKRTVDVVAWRQSFRSSAGSPRGLIEATDAAAGHQDATRVIRG